MPKSFNLKKLLAVALAAVMTLTMTACSVHFSTNETTPSASTSTFIQTASAQPSASETLLPTSTPLPSTSMSPTPSVQSSTSPNSLKYNDHTVSKDAQTVIDLINSGDYTNLFGMFRSDVQQLSSVDALKAVINKALSTAGKFMEIKHINIGTGSSKTLGDFIGAAVTAQHQNTNLLYTIAFDKDMKLIGINFQYGGLATDNQDNETIIKSAETVIDNLNTGNYSADYNLATDNLKQMISADKFKTMFKPILSAAGNFVQYEKSKIGLQFDFSYGTFDTVQIMAHYTSKDLTYIVKFDQDLKIDSLSVS